MQNLIAMLPNSLLQITMKNPNIVTIRENGNGKVHRKCNRKIIPKINWWNLLEILFKNNRYQDYLLKANN
jgi:hypothetical protein